MDTTIKELAVYLLEKIDSSTDHTSRIIVGVCGAPGSGKTSLAIGVVNKINSLYRTINPSSSDEIAICVSQDGWHLPRSALDKFEDVKEAYDRRGAAFTFDGISFSTFILSLKAPMSVLQSTGLSDQTASSLPAAPASAIYAPGFSHTLKDPTENAVAILPAQRIVIVEGLYTFLGIEPWRAASHTLDERWFVDVDAGLARDRLVRRHVLTGLAKDFEEAEWRTDNNDIPNGEFIRNNMLNPTRVIHSVEDPAFAAHGRIE